MKKIWDSFLGILIIPWIIIEGIWSFIPKPSLSWFMDAGIGIIYLIALFGGGIYGCLYFDGWWIIGVVIMVMTPILYMEPPGDEVLGASFFASAVVVGLISIFVYIGSDIAGIDMKKEKVTIYKVQNIKYIVDPNGYLLMDKNTTKTYKIDRDNFYSFRERECLEIYKTKIVHTSVRFSDKFGRTTDIKYECIK